MNEETTDKGAGEAAANNSDGNKPAEANLIERASEAAQRLEKAIERQHELNAKHEALIAQSKLAGKAEAGAPIATAEQRMQEHVKAESEKIVKSFFRNG